MSDFDEEAERRRLREKYEKDEARREETQQMSELLLKGATMTNQHCGECGSPIFRYDGQEFCPSCQRVAGEAGGQADADADASAEPPQSSPQTPQAGERSAGESASPAAESNTAANSVDVDAVGVAGGEPGIGAVDGSASTSPETEAPSGRPGGPTGETSGVGDARAALLRALTRHAELAEATEDPRRAKDHLAAAREASEALDTLDR